MAETNIDWKEKASQYAKMAVQNSDRMDFLETEVERLKHQTPEMLLAGARSIGNTMGVENHQERAAACWKAMTAAAHGVQEPRPAGSAQPKEG